MTGYSYQRCKKCTSLGLVFIVGNSLCSLVAKSRHLQATLFFCFGQ